VDIAIMARLPCVVSLLQASLPVKPTAVVYFSRFRIHTRISTREGTVTALVENTHMSWVKYNKTSINYFTTNNTKTNCRNLDCCGFKNFVLVILSIMNGEPGAI
jgi:hypothetical protein